MKTGTFQAIFLGIHPVSVGFVLVLAFFLNSVLTSEYLTLSYKMVLVAFVLLLTLMVAVFESYEPKQKTLREV